MFHHAGRAQLDGLPADVAGPGEPLRIAFRGLHTNDPRLRGTALEYLEHVLPPAIRERLWPLLDGARPPAGTGRSRETVLADLLQSNPSIMMNLDELRRLHQGTTLSSATRSGGS